MFDPADHLHTRYLDLSQVVQPDLQNLHYIAYLQFLNLSSCGLDKVSLADLVIGNIGVLVYRVVFENLESSSGFRVLVTNLCVSDFLMGIYMMIIGSADALYSGRYIWKQEAWTTSGHCKVAGFLALLSSEVSALIISLITLDRMLVLCFPMRRNLHLTPRSSMIVCGAVWVLGLMLASAPLVPAEWTFYGQTGICLPLPITRKPSPGQRYAFGVFVIFNFFVFLLIGTGQVVIFRAIRKTPIFDKTHRRKQDMSVARRLFLIVCTDFCCWFPITLAALLASQGTPIPEIQQKSSGGSAKEGNSH
nr:hypothetical protein BaRGS_000357 [Batillaria attramentaria]